MMIKTMYTEYERDKVGKNLETIQAANRSNILKRIQRKRLCSRAELAKYTGLKQATITNITKELIAEGIVEETGLIEGEKGRRAIGLKLSEDRYYVIGVRLARKHFEIGLFSLFGDLVSDRCRVSIKDSTPKIVIAEIVDVINRIIAENADKSIISIGVAVPGPYYYKDGMIEAISNFPGWKNVAIVEELQKNFDIPVIVDHDANAGVLAECATVVDTDAHETVLYIAIGQGIGAGLYNEGKVYRGSSGIAGEIGHTSINIDGPVCECGNRGCLTSYVSTIAFVDQVQAAQRAAGEPISSSFSEMIEPIRNHEGLIYREFKDCMRHLGVGMVNIIYCYNPDLIIIGDEMSQIGLQIIEELEQYVPSIIRKRENDLLKIQLATQEYDPAFLGAAQLAIETFFEHTNQYLTD